MARNPCRRRLARVKKLLPQSLAAKSLSASHQVEPVTTLTPFQVVCGDNADVCGEENVFGEQHLCRESSKHSETQ